MADYNSLKFKIKDQPELEAALNALGDAINRLRSGEAFFNTRNIKVRSEEQRVGFDYMPDPVDRRFDLIPLYIVPFVPPYIPQPSPPGDGVYRVAVTWGSVNNLLASNWDQFYDLTDTTYFFMKIVCPPTGALELSSCEIVTGPNYDTFVSDLWELGEDRPATLYSLMGVVDFTTPEYPIIQNFGGGSMLVTEHVTDVIAGGDGTTRIGKQLVTNRIVY